MKNAIVIIILAAVLGFAIYYLVKSKKRGDKCIGCPYAKTCGGKCDKK
ncbi:MAG: FeoB-associated Cys-rich membrane protein [Clostridia bacterium]|nr:FeoB-associated Cys-rich membrane protein [Clostridia bacterium]